MEEYRVSSTTTMIIQFFTALVKLINFDTIITGIVLAIIGYILGARKQKAEVRQLETTAELNTSTVHKNVVTDALATSQNWKQLAEERHAEIEELQETQRLLIERTEKQDIIIDEMRDLNYKLLNRVSILEDKIKDKDGLEIRFQKLERYSRQLYDAFIYLSDEIAQVYPDLVQKAKAKVPDIGL